MGKWLKNRVQKTSIKIDDIILSAFGRPLLILVMGSTIWSAIFYGTSLPEKYPDFFRTEYLTTFYIVIGAWIITHVIRDFFRVYGFEIVREQGKKELNTFHFLQKGIVTLIWIICFLLILSTLKIDIGPLLATGGVIGLIISLGGQDVIGNFLSGIVIATDKPFRIGDRVKVGQYLGDIEDIGSYSTRIRTLDSQIIIVPNEMLTNDMVINYAIPNEKLKVRVNIGVAYGSDVQKVKEILVSIGNKTIEKGLCLQEYPPEVYFLEFAASSLNFQLIMWTNSYTRVWEVTDYINCEIDTAFKAAGIEIPFPQMDVHMRG